MSTKDYFSGHSKIYAAFRPTYPKELYDYIFKHVVGRERAWDCATGNGQVARYLSSQFKKVQASDISKQQIENAFQATNIEYTICRAEQTPFEDHSFDLITVGQALHWFNIDAFYREVKRTMKKDGVIAVWGYANLSVSPEIDKHFLHFYNNVVGPFWDEARHLVEDEYRTIPFPFAEIETPKFSIDVDWNSDQFFGYLTSWSATQKFIDKNEYNPVENFKNVLAPLWKKDEVKRVKFPVFLRLGKV